MTSSNQNNVLHPYPYPKLFRVGKPGVDVVDNPFTELAKSGSVLTSSSHWKGQYGTIFLCALKRYFRRVGFPSKEVSNTADVNLYDLVTLERAPLIHQIVF